MVKSIMTIAIASKRRLSCRWSCMSLFSFMTRNHLPTLILAIIFALLASLIVPMFAILLGSIFNTFTSFGRGEISSEELVQNIALHCVSLAALGVLSWILNGSYFILFVVFGELQVSNARTMLFEGLLGRDQEWFETQQDGTKAFLSYLQAQTHELQMATSQPLGLILQYSFRTLASLALGFYTSWNLSLVTLAGIPIFSVVLAFLSSKIKSIIEAQQNELIHASKVANGAINSIDMVKCLNGQAFEFRSFAIQIDKAALYYLRKVQLNSLQIATIRLMMFGIFVQGFWYGSTLATSGRLTAGEVLTTFWACLTAAQSIELALPQVIVLEKGKIAALSLKDILNQTEARSKDMMRGLSCPQHCEGDIEVSNLSFSYPSQPSRPVLHPSSFFFPAGETTFIIGKSGAGKSTLGQLLARLYLPTSGEILIDGAPIQTLSDNWIRNNITLVEQRSVLFNESIFTNIAIGCRGHELIMKEDVEACIDLAMFRSTIENLPEGIDTCVGHGGSLLSGGQRQRVAIARARLRNTPILILDEPTSALDGTNRVAMTRAIREWRKGKTTIIITHDMSQIMERDFVYILDQGSVVQAGYKYELEASLRNEKYFPFSDKTVSSGDPKFHKGDADLSADASAISSTKNILKTSGAYCLPESQINMKKHIHFPDMDRVNVSVKETAISNFSARGMYEPDNLFQSRPISMPHSLHRAKIASCQQSTKRPSTKRKIARLPKQHDLRQVMLTIIPSLNTKQRFLLLLGVLCTLSHACATPVFSYCLSQIFGSFYDKDAKAMKWALCVIGVAIYDGVASSFMHYFLELCGQAWVDCLRKSAFQRILEQPREWFEEEGNSPARLAACLDQNGEDIRNLVGHFGGFILVAAAIALIAIIWSLAVCWKVTLVALSCGPVIYTITRAFEGASRLWETRCNEIARVTSEIFVETFSEIRTVRTLTLELFFHIKYLKAESKCMLMGLKRAAYTGLLFGLVESTIIFVSALIFYYGALLASSLEFTVNDILTVFSILLFSIGYAGTVLSWIPQINSSMDTATQLLRLANLPQKASHEHQGNQRVSKAVPIKITELNFRYPSRPDALVLRDIDFVFPENSCTAIIGRSGSGKSTIASLLLSLYEAPPSKSRVPAITLGGVDIRCLHTPSLRSLLSIVSQQPTIFPGTLYANITYGLEEGSPLRKLSDVRAAARAAGIDDFIASLPKGYLTVVGDGGVGLSSGQAQRLMIARALVRRPQVLILDEATSSLDKDTARVIRQTVQRLVSARLVLTIIIITHSREMMEIADNIILLEKGSIVERGPYSVIAKRLDGRLKALIED